MSELPGAATSLIPRGVALLDAEERVFESMLEGWRRQQQSRNLKADTYKDRERIVREFQRYTNDYPWDWGPQDFVDYSASLHARVVHSTFRGYQNAIRLFDEYVCDARYGWPDECLRRFGSAPAFICDEWNTAGHASDFEGKPERRPLTFDEVEAFFDYLDARVDHLYAKGEKGSVAALRDAALFKVTYAYGLRRREVARLALSDFHANPAVKQYGRLGSIHVRYGKSIRGGPPRRRIVLTVPEFDWSVDVLEQYIREIRDQLNPGDHPALFPSERAAFLNLEHLGDRFRDAIREAGLPDDIEMHSLRHSYATHLAEYGYDPLFIQTQLGHSYAATTAIYTHISSEFKNRQIEEAIYRLYGR